MQKHSVSLEHKATLRALIRNAEASGVLGGQKETSHEDLTRKRRRSIG